MYNFHTWLDRWVRDKQRDEAAGNMGSPAGADQHAGTDAGTPPEAGNSGVARAPGAPHHARAPGDSGDRGGRVRYTRRFPDDPVVDRKALLNTGGTLAVAESPSCAEAEETAPKQSLPERMRDFAGFWLRHRPHPELDNLSLSTVRCLLGAREARFSGFLSIREDLPGDRYLELPFVRRCWRLLWILDEYQHGDYCGEPLLVGSRREHRGINSGMRFTWALTRELDMNPETAQVNMRAMVQFLVEAGLIETHNDCLLSERARGLVAGGSPGSFYKALCLRAFNRCMWDRADGLPPLISIQLNGLYLLYALHARFRDSAIRDGLNGCSRSVSSSESLGTSAMDLARRIDSINRILRFDPEPSYWVKDVRVVARAIHFRLLSRLGRILGLIEPVADLNESSPRPEERFYRPTHFAERVMLWNP